MSQNNITVSKADIRTWLVDFDETLAVGTLTWVLEHTFPQFILEHQLPYDKDLLHKAMLSVQERSRQTPDNVLLLTSLFDMLKWPQSLQEQFMADIGSSYRPSLFEDTLPFFDRVRTNNQTIYIVSNNKRTPQNVQALGIEQYINGVFTPASIPNTHPKPHTSLWDYIKTLHTDINPLTTGVIGDDPWSDGVFAENCGLPCWIIDRTNRFTELYDQKPYQWAGSLRDI